MDTKSRFTGSSATASFHSALRCLRGQRLIRFKAQIVVDQLGEGSDLRDRAGAISFVCSLAIKLDCRAIQKATTATIAVAVMTNNAVRKLRAYRRNLSTALSASLRAFCSTFAFCSAVVRRSASVAARACA